MKKLLIVCVAFTLALTSCKKSSDDVEPAHKNLLTKRTDTDGLVFNFTYDASNRMVSYTRTSNAFSPAQNFSFTYNATGALVEYFESVTSTRTKYTYNVDATINTKKDYGVSGAIETLEKYIHVYLCSGNCNRKLCICRHWQRF